MNDANIGRRTCFSAVFCVVLTNFGRMSCVLGSVFLGNHLPTADLKVPAADLPSTGLDQQILAITYQ